MNIKDILTDIQFRFHENLESNPFTDSTLTSKASVILWATEVLGETVTEVVLDVLSNNLHLTVTSQADAVAANIVPPTATAVPAPINPTLFPWSAENVTSILTAYHSQTPDSPTINVELFTLSASLNEWMPYYVCRSLEGFNNFINSMTATEDPKVRYKLRVLPADVVTLVNS